MVGDGVVINLNGEQRRIPVAVYIDYIMSQILNLSYRPCIKPKYSDEEMEGKKEPYW